MMPVTSPLATAASARTVARSTRRNRRVRGSAAVPTSGAIILVIAVLVVASPCLADSTPPLVPAPTQPGSEDRCPVCGMFVARYPDWVAQVQFDDGQIRYFDGPKDMFKFLFNLERYLPGKSRQDVSVVYVTDYYALRPIRAEDAHFVKGSDVYGPMGLELVPLASKEEALEFRQDHKGTEIYRLQLVTAEVISDLD